MSRLDPLVIAGHIDEALKNPGRGSMSWYYDVVEWQMKAGEGADALGYYDFLDSEWHARTEREMRARLAGFYAQMTDAELVEADRQIAEEDAFRAERGYYPNQAARIRARLRSFE